MNVIEILEAMGGRAKVASLVRVCPAQMTQMRTRGKIADHNIRFFIALRPELDWPELLEEDFERFVPVLNEKHLVRLRKMRLWRQRQRERQPESEPESQSQ
ncbi:hypothetical protein B0G84_5703 [Paraburkholderia sp. BL8N3]|nr:hypothetical protein [Paraburkholderia sp. BL8N3]TCK36690.1 hypothetical protein B0G84_5703 [Paraburkholderia sp. BL8N3]